METCQIIYSGEKKGFVQEFARNIGYLIKEVEILESLEKLFSEFISSSVAGLSEAERGKVWLNRFNSRDIGQDAFSVEFVPTRAEVEKVKYSQVEIAVGRFLTKEIFFFPGRSSLYYVEAEVIPFLQKLFTKLGFEIKAD